MAQRWFGVWKPPSRMAGRARRRIRRKQSRSSSSSGPRGPRAGHQPVTGDQALEAEGGVRRGMKIAGGIVKAPVVPLGALHKGGRQFHGAQQLSRFKMGAAGVQIGCQRSGKRINGRFCLPDVPAYSAITGGNSGPKPAPAEKILCGRSAPSHRCCKYRCMVIPPLCAFRLSENDLMIQN